MFAAWPTRVASTLLLLSPIPLAAGCRSNVYIAVDEGSWLDGSIAPARDTQDGSAIDAPSSRPGYLHTRGARIVDAEERVVQLTGLNWPGMDTAAFAPDGLLIRSLDTIAGRIASLGYNVVRIPFSNQMFDATSVPNQIDFAINPDLSGKTALEILDKVVAAAARHGLKIILAREGPAAGGESALWYTAEYPETRWTTDWEALAGRYANDSTVVGVDLHNAPRDPTGWADGSPDSDWRAAAQRAGNALLAINPDLLVLVQGTSSEYNYHYWPGGNLRAAGQFPVVLAVPNHIVYAVRDFAPSENAGQPWFIDAVYPRNLAPLWYDTWGYLAVNEIAPVVIAEFGGGTGTADDLRWFAAIAAYIQTNQLSFAFWSTSPLARGRVGLFEDDWMTPVQATQARLQPLLAPPLF